MPGDFHPGIAFNALQLVDFASGNQRKGSTGPADAAGAANPVHVVFLVPGQVVVENDFNVVDVDSSSSHVGRHEKLQAGISKFFHDSLALSLAHVAMNTVR